MDGSRWLPVSPVSNQDWSYVTSNTVALGACNEDDNNMSFQWAVAPEESGGNWSYFTPGTLLPDQKVRRWDSWSSPGARWGAGGLGDLYHLRTAILMFDPWVTD